MPQQQPNFIFANGRDRAEQFARTHGLRPKSWSYILSADDLKSRMSGHVWVVDGAQHRWDYIEVRDVILKSDRFTHESLDWPKVVDRHAFAVEVTIPNDERPTPGGNTITQLAAELLPCKTPPTIPDDERPAPGVVELSLDSKGLRALARSLNATADVIDKCEVTGERVLCTGQLKVKSYRDTLGGQTFGIDSDIRFHLPR